MKYYWPRKRIVARTTVFIAKKYRMLECCYSHYYLATYCTLKHPLSSSQVVSRDQWEEQAGLLRLVKKQLQKSIWQWLRSCIRLLMNIRQLTIENHTATLGSHLVVAWEHSSCAIYTAHAIEVSSETQPLSAAKFPIPKHNISMGVDILPVKAAVYNKQPHILKVKKGMQRDPKYTSDRYTFMLPHKHFDLREGEILWVDKLADAYAVCVRRHNQIDREALPCMWLFDDGWKPIAYTQEEFGSRDIPDIPPGDYSIGMRWLNSAGL